LRLGPCEKYFISYLRWRSHKVRTHAGPSDWLVASPSPSRSPTSLQLQSNPLTQRHASETPSPTLPLAKQLWLGHLHEAPSTSPLHPTICEAPKSSSGSPCRLSIAFLARTYSPRSDMTFHQRQWSRYQHGMPTSECYRTPRTLHFASRLPARVKCPLTFA